MNRNELLPAAVLALLAACPIARSQTALPAPRVVVFGVEDRGIRLPPVQLEILGDYLAQRFSEAAGMKVVPRQEVQRQLGARGLKACFERACQMDVERAVGADYGLTARIDVLGDVCLFNASLYPRGSKTASRTALVRGSCTSDALVAAIDALVKKLTASGALRPQAPGRPPVVVVPDAVRQPPHPVAPPPAASDRPWSSTRPGATAKWPEEWGTVEGRQVEGALTAARPIDAWPAFLMSLDLVYAPAPWRHREKAGGWVDAKLLDQLGPQMAIEWRVASYMLLGAHFSTLVNAEDFLSEFAFRIGGIVPFDESLALQFAADLGFSVWSFRREETEAPSTSSDESRMTENGLTATLSVGIRFRLGRRFGLHAELAGGLGSYQELDMYLLRLQLALGLTF